MFMKEMLLALKKAVDEALAADPPTEEIPLAEFPSHVVKSLEAILGDTNGERAARRLATLQAELDEACTLVKQGDDAQVIRVVVHEESELMAKRAANAELAPMLEKLAREVAALKQALASGNAEQRKAENDQADAGQGKPKGKAKPRAASGKMPPKPKTSSPKSRAADSTDDEQDAPTPTKKGDGQDAARMPAEWADWPMDMNWTMPDAEPETRDPDFDWGADPEEEP
jgi:hypothetical protein